MAVDGEHDGAFARSPSIAIDVAVMEKTPNGAVVPADIGWSDVGSWAALWGLAAKDTHGNVQLGDVIAAGAGDCYLRSDGALEIVEVRTGRDETQGA